MAVPAHVCVAGSGVPTTAARGDVDGTGRPVLLARPGETLYGVPAQTLVTAGLTASREIGGVGRDTAMTIVMVPVGDCIRSGSL